jgi:hypothetical protein
MRAEDTVENLERGFAALRLTRPDGRKYHEEEEQDGEHRPADGYRSAC